MKHLFNIVAMALTLLVVFTACNDGSCYDNGSSLPLATFYTSLDTTSQVSVNRLSIKGIGAPGDSLLADSTTLTQSYLPLRATVNHTEYALTRVVTVDSVDVTLHDTISLTYDVIPYFHSAECGAMYNFELNAVDYTTWGVIDSIIVATTHVTNSHNPVLKIIFTPY